jgi:hypothetical protein
LTIDIPFTVSLLLPEVAAPHPLREALTAAITLAAANLLQQIVPSVR